MVPNRGGLVPERVVASNLEFLQRFKLEKIEKRVINHVQIDQDLIRSGDLLVSRKMTGFDTYYMVATGGAVADVAVTLRDEDGVLWVWDIDVL